MHSIPAERTYRYGKDSRGASGLRIDLHESRLRLYRELGYEVEEEPYGAEGAGEELPEDTDEYDDMNAGAGA